MGYPATGGTPQPCHLHVNTPRVKAVLTDTGNSPVTTVTQAARLASAEGNHASDDRCPLPRRCPSPRETRAETDRQPDHCGSDRGREISVPNSGVSLIGQPGQGAEGDDVMALHRDVTGLARAHRLASCLVGVGVVVPVFPLVMT
ncbi:hypothetical protein ACOMHN_006903 [Nucella lapillus]